MDAPKSMDRLSLLPNELLDNIFNLAHTETEPLTGPLSKHLLPSFHRSFYRNILLSSYKHLGRLCDTSRARPHLASLVWTMRLEIAKETEEGRELEDPQKPTNEAVLELFSTSTNLRKLRLRGSSRVASLLLSPPDERRFPFLSKLRVLQLAASFDSHPDPFKFIMLSTLHRYRSLVTLTLDIHRLESSVESELIDAAQEIDDQDHILPELCSLSLQGPLVASRYAAKIVGSAPAVVDLVLLISASSFSAIRDLLISVHHPDRLQALTLAGTSAEILPIEILQPLKLFTNLKSLILDIPSSFANLVPTLSQSSLVIIDLRWLCIVQLTALTKIITGTTKIKTLAILKLDTVTATRGKPIPRDVGRQELVELDLDSLGWDLPEWYDDFSKDDFKEFVKLAAKEDVVVIGNALKALIVERAWEEEMKYYRSVMES